MYSKDRYIRQVNLSEVGIEGQRKLEAAHIVVVGLGGLGSAAISYLAGAGVGEVTLVEPGFVEESNLHRQMIYTEKSVGELKTDACEKFIHNLNSNIIVNKFSSQISTANCLEVCNNATIILDCTDSFRAKFVINDFAWRAQIPAISASIYRFEGQLLFFHKPWPCLRCIYKEEYKDSDFKGCDETGVLGPVPGFFGLLQAVEALKYILEIESPLRSGKLLVADLVNFYFELISIPCRCDCPTCNPAVRMNNEGDKIMRMRTNIEVESGDLAGFEKVKIVDVREMDEVRSQALPFENVLVAPMSVFNPADFDANFEYVFVCAHGIRSLNIATYFRENGKDNYYSLKGGLAAI